MKIRIEFDVPDDEIDSKSDLDAAVAWKIIKISHAIARDSFDALPEYTYEDTD